MLKKNKGREQRTSRMIGINLNQTQDRNIHIITASQDDLKKIISSRNRSVASIKTQNENEYISSPKVTSRNAKNPLEMIKSMLH
jgi:hypothetical protein